MDDVHLLALARVLGLELLNPLPLLVHGERLGVLDLTHRRRKIRDGEGVRVVR